MGLLDDVLGTNVFGSNSTDRAIGAQTSSANQANQFLGTQYDQAMAALKQSYDSQMGIGSQYNQAGLNALSSLASGDFANNLSQDPGYQFRLEQGRKAIEGSAAARGSLNSGATLKALERYGQDYASNEYQNAYNRDYQRLSQVAGLGANANSNLMSASGQYGTNLASLLSGYGNAVSNNITGLGNANAAAQISQANRGANLLGQGATAGAMIYALSDRRAKENIRELNQDDIKEMKKHLKAYAFNYKNDEHGKGDWIGVMAQDLEKSKLGRTLVVYDRFGNKMIDLRKVLSMFLSTMAEA